MFENRVSGDHRLTHLKISVGRTPVAWHTIFPIFGRYGRLLLNCIRFVFFKNNTTFGRRFSQIVRRGAFSVSLRGRSKDIHGYYRVIISILFIEIDFYLKKTGGGGEKKDLKKETTSFPKGLRGTEKSANPRARLLRFILFFYFIFRKNQPYAYTYGKRILRKYFIIHTRTPYQIQMNDCTSRENNCVECVSVCLFYRIRG